MNTIPVSVWISVTVAAAFFLLYLIERRGRIDAQDNMAQISEDSFRRTELIHQIVAVDDAIVRIKESSREWMFSDEFKQLVKERKALDEAFFKEFGRISIRDQRYVSDLVADLNVISAR